MLVATKLTFPSTRPLLTLIEKKWMVFQLLTALSQAHFYGVCHGDIKCENVMVTSWNWIYLADFASYKPVSIPEVTSVHCRIHKVRIIQLISLSSLIPVEEESVIWLLRDFIPINQVKQI